MESKQNKSKLKENVNLSVLFSVTQNSTISFLEWMSVLALTQTPPRGREHSAQRTGRTAQQLRASGPPEDLGSIPNTHMVAHRAKTQAPGDPTASSGLCGHQAHVWSTDMYAGKTRTHIKRK